MRFLFMQIMQSRISYKYAITMARLASLAIVSLILCTSLHIFG